MSSSNNLFRAEVVNNQNNRLGQVFINTSVSYQVLVIGFGIIMLSICIFIINVSFAEKFIVPGYIRAAEGTISVFPNQNGIIVKSFVHVGAKVKRGQLLFIIDTTNDNLTKNNKNDLNPLLNSRRVRIQKEVERKKLELNDLKKILDKKYISRSDFNSKQSELNTLEDNLTMIEVEQRKYQQALSYEIRAPLDGVVSSVVYNPGQYSDNSKPLVKIIPKGNGLVAELLVPVRYSGFLQTGDSILLRYDAYPYQYFGLFTAIIKTIHQSILTDGEDNKPINLGEPYYKVISSLVNTKNIRDGMTFTAVIQGPERKIWQWIFSPFFQNNK